MALASLPIWMEGVINRKYPKWREIEHNPDGSARYMPAGVRLVEKSLLRLESRGVILRGAGITHLWLDGLALFTMGSLLLVIAARRFQKKVIMA